VTVPAGRHRLHDHEAAADFWRGYLWGHFDAAAELLLALGFPKRKTSPAEILAAAQELKTRRRLLEEAKGVLGPVGLAAAHRLLTEDESE